MTRFPEKGHKRPHYFTRRDGEIIGIAGLLNAESGTEVLRPAANDLLQQRAVSTRVNSSRADDALLIEAIPLH